MTCVAVENFQCSMTTLIGHTIALKRTFQASHRAKITQWTECDPIQHKDMQQAKALFKVEHSKHTVGCDSNFFVDQRINLIMWYSHIAQRKRGSLTSLVELLKLLCNIKFKDYMLCLAQDAKLATHQASDPNSNSSHSICRCASWRFHSQEILLYSNSNSLNLRWFLLCVVAA